MSLVVVARRRCRRAHYRCGDRSDSPMHGCRRTAAAHTKPSLVVIYTISSLDPNHRHHPSSLSNRGDRHSRARKASHHRSTRRRRRFAIGNRVAVASRDRFSSSPRCERRAATTEWTAAAAARARRHLNLVDDQRRLDAARHRKSPPPPSGVARLSSTRWPDNTKTHMPTTTR